MNKKIFILALTSTLLFTSCNKKNANKKGDVVNDAVLKANTKEIKKSIFSDFSLQEGFTSDITKEYVAVSNGFIVINNGEKISYYSTLKNEIDSSNQLPYLC